VRVGLVTTSYPRFPGDPAGGFVAEHAAFLARAGHDVDVIAAGSDRASHAVDAIADDSGRAGRDVDAIAGAVGAPAWRTTDEAARRVRVHRVAAPPGLFDQGGAPEALAGSARAWIAAGRFSVALARAVARRAPGWDAVVAHWLVPSGLAALLAAPRLPLLAIAHSGDVHLLRRMGGLGAMGWLCARREARLSFVTDELRRLFLAAAPRCSASSQVCPMGIDVARLRSVGSARGSGVPTVLFLGRLVPVKGVDVLVRAAARWRSGARLVVGGAGPAEAELRALAAAEMRGLTAAAPGRIQFAGQLLGGDRDRALAAADIVALPSVRVEGGRTEGLPVVALEAMAAGAALVASAVGGLAELPPSTVTRVRPGDPAALADAVDALVLDPVRRRTQIDAQDRHIRAFDWDAIGPRLMPVARGPGEPRRDSRKRFRRSA
jgi:glycosyltransferase involved in cell wall biosynthesis